MSMKRLTRLSPHHEIAIRMRLEGKPNEEIEEALGVKERTLHKWFSEPLVKTEMERQTSAINSLFAERMAGLGVSALDAMLEMVTADHKGRLSPHQRLEVAREVLDRIPSLQKPVPTAPGSGPPVGIAINNYSSLSDDELRAEARRLAQEVADEQPKALASGNGSATP